MSKKQILRKTFIFYGMDYSEYYLKNYKALREGIEGMNYNNAYYRYYNAERQMKYEPAVIYTQPAPKGAEEDKRADIEYDPNAYIAEEYYPVTVERVKKARSGGEYGSLRCAYVLSRSAVPPHSSLPILSRTEPL